MEKKLQKVYLGYLQFINTAGFMPRSLSNLINYFSKEIYKTKSIYGNDDKKCDIFRIKYKYFNCFF